MKGIRYTFVENDKFKTGMLGLFFAVPIQRETAAVNALVPAVLRRGSMEYPTMKDISKKLESLYGAKFDCGVSKKGEYQILRFYGEVVNQQFVQAEENPLIELAKVIQSIVFHPLLENGIFKKEYVEQEKENLKDLIESRKNDKVQYALERCYELMFDGEPMGLCEFGSVEEVDEISPEALTAAYQRMVKDYQVDIVLSGKFEESEVKALQEQFAFVDREKLNAEIHSLPAVNDVKTFTEQFDINQGKLSLGYNVNIDINSDEYFQIMVYNGILGGGVQSKLFQNVREKYSLAYYAFSRFDKFQSTIGISCGIEIANYQKALDTVLEQVKDISEGKISDYEYETTIKTLVNSLKSMKDEQVQLLDFNYSQILLGTSLKIDEIIEKIQKVTVEEVVNISKRVSLNTIYFMTSSQS
ncbi:MAG: insulinase family protein [Clostridia bacterium]|nr:insulinase family protein [Clostridia bacterium]